MLATPDNMKICESNGINAVVYSHETGERYSASSGDYWNIEQRVALIDSVGKKMRLVRKVAHYEDINE